MEGRRYQIFTAVQLVAVGFLFWFLVVWKTPWNAQRYIGTTLVVVGVIFIGMARYQLGKSFSIKPEARELLPPDCTPRFAILFTCLAL